MKIKKLLLSTTIIIVLLVISSNIYASQKLFHGEDIKFNIEPDKITMDTYIPSDQISNKIDIEIDNFGEDRVIVLFNNNHYLISFKNGLVISNKGNKKLENNPLLVNGHILLPVEFLVEILDINIIDKSRDIPEYGQKDIKSNIYINKTEYEEDENMEVKIEIMNRSNNTKYLEFSSGKMYDIYIRNTNGDIIYTWSKNKMFNQAFKEIKIGVSGSIHYEEKINLSGFVEGTYYIEAQIETVNNIFKATQKQFSIDN